MTVSIQRPAVEVRIAGRVVPNVVEVTTDAGFDSINSQATIVCLVRPDWAAENDDVTVWASNDGNSGQIFGGEVRAFDWTYAPGKVAIDCRDLLSRTRVPWGGDDYDYADQAPDAIIRNGLEKEAIPSGLANIEASDILPNLGIVQPLTLKAGDSVYDVLISPIDALDGYATFTTTHGTIIRRRVRGAVGPSGALTLSKGVQLLTGIRRNRSVDDIRNRIIVTGLTYEGLTVGGPGVGETSTPNPYVTDPTGYVTDKIQSNLVEDDDTALAVAQRQLLIKNRRPEALDGVAMPLDPRVQPAMTVTIVHADLETGTANVLVEHVTHRASASGFTTTLRTTGGTMSGPITIPPIATFALSLFRDGSLIVGVADGSQSYDPDGSITDYSWAISATGATPSPTSVSGATATVARFTVADTATDVTVALTVTDNDGQTNTYSATTTVNLTTMLVEDLYLAYGDVAVTTDGEQNWQTATPASGSATCLMPIAPDWGQLWGTDSGHIYATFDNLATALVDLGQPHGAVACTAVWVHETDTTRLWAGFDDGQVWYGALDVTAQTATWTHAGTIADSPVNEIRESIGTIGELRATAGAGYYYSTDGGVSWSLQHTFDTAWRMAAGFDTNLASGLNDPNPIYDEDGTPPTVPSLTPAVEHIRGLSFGWRVEELYAADDQARLFLGAGPSFDLSEHADTTPAQTNHMIRSGNVDRTVYLALGDGTGTNGAYKWIPGTLAPTELKDTAATGACYMVGYGAAHVPVLALRATILMLPNGASGAADKLWILDAATGVWTGKALPESNKDDWFMVKANPFNPFRLLLLRRPSVTNDSNALYYSDNFGDSWTNIFTDLSNQQQYLQAIAWASDIGDRWTSSRNSNIDSTEYVLRGTGTSYVEISTGRTNARCAALPGQGGEDIYMSDSSGRTGYIDLGGTAHTMSPTALAAGWLHDRPGSRKAAHVRENAEVDISVTDDYRTQTYTTITGATAARWIGILANDTIVGGGRSSGILEVVDPWGTPSYSTAAFSGTGVGAVAVDSQTRTIAAAIRTPGGTSTYAPAIRNPTTGLWTLLARPPAATDLAPVIEVVNLA